MRRRAEACWWRGRLARKPKVEKRVAVTVFSFPPDKGNVGTAAYLNVFGSIFRVLTVRACGRAACLPCVRCVSVTACGRWRMEPELPLVTWPTSKVHPDFMRDPCLTRGRARAQDLKEDGYDVGELPADEGALMQSVLNDPEAKYNSADLNVAYKMPVAEYQRLCPYAEALEENWGKPPGARLVAAGAAAHAPAFNMRFAPTPCCTARGGIC